MGEASAPARGRAKRKAWAILALLVALLLMGAALLYGGAFPAAADEPHSQPLTKLIEMVRDRSVAARSAAIVVPPLDESLVARGAPEYAEMCAGCHGAPGAAKSELQRGLYPAPPDLSDHGMDPKRTFWVIKHGLKMTGMPAWGGSHGDDEVWALVAFVGKLRGMSPSQYQKMVGARAMGSGNHGESNGTASVRALKRSAQVSGEAGAAATGPAAAAPSGEH